jgi:hypothetical protein
MTLSGTPTQSGTFSFSVTLKDSEGAATLPVTQSFSLVIKPPVVLPTLTTITPSFGPLIGGTPVTIHGSHLTDATKVLFGDRAGVITMKSPHLIVVNAPSSSVSQPVTVTVVFPSRVKVTASQRFTYLPQPHLQSVNPPSVPQETAEFVTITGAALTTNATTCTGVLAMATCNVQVFFGGVPGIVAYASPTTLEVITPKLSTRTASLSVTVDGEPSSNTLPFTFRARI